MLKHEVSPQPPRVGQVTFTFDLAEPSGAPITGAEVNLEGNMSHAGMAPVLAEAQEIEAGRYRATMDLSMAGDWIVLVHATLLDGRKLERQITTQISAD